MPDSIPNLLLNYGPPALAVAIFVGALGVPLPGTTLLLATGALARGGLVSVPAVVVMAVLAVSAAVLGDGTSYGLARRGFKPFLSRLEGNSAWRRAERAFERKGAFAILLSRFLVTPLALPTNLIAGGERYPFARFVSFCLVGETVWVVLFGGLGYPFAGSWRAIGGIAGDLGLWLAVAAVVALGCYEAYHLWRHHTDAQS